MKIKKLAKKFALIWMCLLCAFTNTGIMIHANTYTPVSLGTIKGTGAKLSQGGGWAYWRDGIGKISVNDEIAFCIEPMTLGLGGTYSKHDDIPISLQRKLSRIVYYGWDTTSKSNDDYAVTQYMVWEAVGANIDEWYGDFGSRYNTLKANVQYKIDRHTLVPSFASENYEVDLGESLTISDTKGVLNDFHVKSDGGANVRISGNNLVITPNENTPDNITISLQKELDSCLGTSIAYRSSADDGQDVAVIKVSDPSIVNVRVKVNKFGNMNITKLNEDGNSVPNTKFKLSYNSDMSDPIGTYTTGSNGSVLVQKLRPKTVYVQEIEVPAPYVLDSTIRSLKVVANDTVAYQANNRYKVGKVKIQKKDTDTHANVLTANAEFDIFTSSGVYVQTVKTNAKGIAESGWLRYGDYFFTEKLAPDQYTQTAKKIYFEIRKDQETIQTEIENKRVTASLRIYKYDSVNGNNPLGDATLEGAVYELYAKDNIISPDDKHVIYKQNDLVSTLTIKNGTASISNLYLGNYYLKEKKPSNGYTLDTNIYPVSFKYADQNTANIHIEKILKERVIAQPFSIIKVSSNGTSGEIPAVKGAEFTVKLKSDVEKMGWDDAPIAKNAQGKNTDILVTDSKGYAVSNELPYGTYIVKETKVPDNMYTGKTFEVVINEDNREPQVWRIYNNAPFKAYLKVVKFDEETNSNITLSNASFKIKNTDTDEYVKQWVMYPIPHQVETFTTASDGSFITPKEMSVGNYALEEVKSPSGYLLSKNPIPFTINKNQAYEAGDDEESIIITIKFGNKPVKGQIKIKKEAELFEGFDFRNTEFGKVYEPIFKKGILGGVTYQIYAREDILTNDNTLWYKKGELVEEITTKKNEVLCSSKLPLGKYSVVEKSTQTAFIKDPKSYDIDLVYDTPEKEIVTESMVLWNQRQRGYIEFKKNIEESIHDYDIEAYKNIKFGLFTDEPLIIDGNEELPKDSLLSVITLNQTLQSSFKIDFAGKFYIKELSTDDNYQLSDKKYSFDFKYDKDREKAMTQISNDTLFENTLKRGSVRITKLDSETKKPLVNVKFDLSTTKDMKSIIKSTATSEQGIAFFEELELGTYYIRERELDGYVTNDKVYEVTIKEHEQLIEIEISNKPVKGIVEFTKTGMTFNSIKEIETAFGIAKQPVWEETSLLDAELTIYAKEDIVGWDGTEWFKKDEVVCILESDLEKVKSKELPVGKYYAIETKTPASYIQSEEQYEFEIVGNGKAEVQINSISIHNDRLNPTLDLHKVLEENEYYPNKDAYKDVVFGLFTRDDTYDYKGKVLLPADTLIQTFGINSDGTAKDIINLPIGNYFIKELKTSPDHNLDPTEYDFSYEYQESSKKEYSITINKGKDILNTLKRSDIVISKEDKYTHKPLANAEFTLYDLSMKEISKTKSDKDGKAYFKELPNGTYYLKESNAPAGYALSKETVKVVLDGTNKEYKVTMTNVLLPSNVVNTGVQDYSSTYLLLMVISGCLITLAYAVSKKKS